MWPFTQSKGSTSALAHDLELLLNAFLLEGHNAFNLTKTKSREPHEVMIFAGKFVQAQMTFAAIFDKVVRLPEHDKIFFSFCAGVADSFGQAFHTDVNDCLAALPIMGYEMYHTENEFFSDEMRRADITAKKIFEHWHGKTAESIATASGGNSVFTFLNTEDFDFARKSTIAALHNLLG